jgi:hypothetical protein
MIEAQSLLNWPSYPLPGIISRGDGSQGGRAHGESLLEGVGAYPEGTTVLRSGSLDGPAFETWGPKGWAALEARCDALAGELDGADRSGTRLLLLAHASDVLSDTQRCLTFLTKRGGGVGGFGVVIDPMALLTESMLERAGDHLARVAASVLPAYGVAAMVVHPAAYGSRIPESAWGMLIEAAREAEVPLIRTDLASRDLLDRHSQTAGA